jgi:hypothetical protein
MSLMVFRRCFCWWILRKRLVKVIKQLDYVNFEVFGGIWGFNNWANCQQTCLFWFRWGHNFHQPTYQRCYLVEAQLCTFINFSALHGTLDEPSGANSLNFAPSLKVGGDALSFEIGKDAIDYIFFFSSSPKRHLEQCALTKLLETKGLKLLHNVKTMWISMLILTN